LERKTDIISIKAIEQVPSLESIRKTPRNRLIKLVFDAKLNSEREKVGNNLKKKLSGFQIGVHLTLPEINISKLITNKEIDENQIFFEECAKDYRQLGEYLIFKLIDKLRLNLNKEFPIETFNQIKRSKKQIGKIESWKYFVHGFHCGFENIETLQKIEVPLVFGLEFGDLDPYFFTIYIKSTPKYNPLQINIFEDYADGVRINKRMIELGKFERIKSNIEGHFGTVVVDRKKVRIQPPKEIKEHYELQNKKSKFNFLKFIGLSK
jgi:hypothetical protein